MINKHGLQLKINSNTMDVNKSVTEMLTTARNQGRITCGVYESGKMLEMNPDGVMFCVLPEIASDDVTLHIHFTLIEAFCWENNIRIIKVDCVEKLAKILSDHQLSVNDNDISSGRATTRVCDCNCVLVEYPDTPSEADEDVAEFYKVTCCVYPQPVVELAV